MITVTLNNVLLGTYDPVDYPDSFENVTTTSTFLAGGTYNLVFSGVSTGVPTSTFVDAMSFVDNVQVNEGTVPEPSSLALMALGAGCWPCSHVG